MTTLEMEFIEAIANSFPWKKKDQTSKKFRSFSLEMTDRAIKEKEHQIEKRVALSSENNDSSNK